MTDKLEQIEKFASLGMAPAEIEIIVGLERGSLTDYINLKTDPKVQAYLKGKLTTIAELNKSIITLAKQGSGPAQTMAKQLMANQAAKEVDFG